MKKEHEELEDDDGEVTDEDEAGEIDEAQLAKIKPKEEVKWCGGVGLLCVREWRCEGCASSEEVCGVGVKECV